MDLLKVLAGKLAGIKCLSVPRGIDGERTSECRWVHGVCKTWKRKARGHVENGGFFLSAVWVPTSDS